MEEKGIEYPWFSSGVMILIYVGACIESLPSLCACTIMISESIATQKPLLWLFWIAGPLWFFVVFSLLGIARRRSQTIIKVLRNGVLIEYKGKEIAQFKRDQVRYLYIVRSWPKSDKWYIVSAYPVTKEAAQKAVYKLIYRRIWTQGEYMIFPCADDRKICEVLEKSIDKEYYVFIA